MFQFSFRPNQTAVAGALAAGMAIAISSFSIVRAEHVRPDKSKIFMCSAGTACVTGLSSGNGTAGVSGVSTATSGHAYGVYGTSVSGAGVYGGSTSAGHAAVTGQQQATGSNSGIGVYAESADTTGTYEALQAKADNSQTYIFVGYNEANSPPSSPTECLIDPNANLFCTGSIGGPSLRTRHLNSIGQHVLAYASESASATIDDVGTGYMVGGVANVAIDRSFAATIDRSKYHVFLTPDGDASLYVAQKTTAGFVVREVHGGRSTLPFDYRIVARPLDGKNDRLPPAPALRKPIRPRVP
jgi:hypothetical protein